MSTATITKSQAEFAEEIKSQLAQLRCEGCGAEVEAACNCGLPYAYIPARVAAAKAIKANPEKSDRAIAAETGVDKHTVKRARKAGGENSPTGKRVGRDGKAYPATKPKKGSIPVEQEYMARVDAAKAAATVPYKGKVTKEVIALARGVAKAWNELADQMEEQLKALN